MDSLGIFGFGPGGWGLALLSGAAMTLLVARLRPPDWGRDRVAGGLVSALRPSARRRGGRSLCGLVPRSARVAGRLFRLFRLLDRADRHWGLIGFNGFLGVPSFVAGALAVGVISGSYQAEVFRAAYLAIAKGELEAAVSVGMDRQLRFRRIMRRRFCASLCRGSAISGRSR